MKRLALASMLPLGLMAAFASCAADDDATTAGKEDASTVPEAAPQSQPDAGDGSPPLDAGCDAADPSCTTSVVTCDRVAWCTPTTSSPVVHSLLAIWGSAANDVWTVGTGGTILHFDGTSWESTQTDLKNTFYGVWGSGRSDVWVVSSTEVVLHGTGFEGSTTTWTNVATTVPAEKIIRAVWGSSPNDVRLGSNPFGMEAPPPVYVAQGNQFVRTVDDTGATTWTPIIGSAAVTSIWGSSASDVWIAGDNSLTASYARGQIMHGTPGDAGADAGPADSLAWTAIDSQSNVTLESVWGSSANDVWAVGAVGTIRHITSTDVRWQKVASPTNQTLHSVWGSGPDDVWAVGDAGTILHWNGTSFDIANEFTSAQFPIGQKPDLRAVWGSGPNDVWIAGEQILLHFTGRKASQGEHT